MQANEKVMRQMIISRECFMLYGAKATGKTTFIRKLLAETKIPYVEVNCTLAEKRQNFLKLLRFQLHKHLGVLHEHGKSMYHSITIESFETQLQTILNEDDRKTTQLHGLYIFMDNTEQLRVSEKFLPSFYSTFRNQFQMAFIFCGTNYGERLYENQAPFRSLPGFIFPRSPTVLLKIIKDVVYTALQYGFKRGVLTPEMLNFMSQKLSDQLFAALESVEYDLNFVKQYVRLLTEEVILKLEGTDNPQKELTRMIHNHQLAEIIQRSKGIRNEGEELHKKHRDEHSTEPSLEFYPSLLLTSIHLADYYPQSEDKRRFKDYKKSNRHELKRLFTKLSKHNYQRIISIAESLESQTKDNSKELAKSHHTLDFYACFEYLKDEGKIRTVGKGNGLVTSKLASLETEREARNWLKQNGLKYEQYALM